MARFSGAASGTLPASTNVLVATTLPKLQRQIVDNFFTATPFFWWVRQGNRTATWEGGDTLEIPLLYDENPMARAYVPYEVMDVKPPQGITTSIWSLAHYRVPIMWSRQMADANRGKSQIVNLIESLKQQAQLSLVKTINDDLFSESTQQSNKINSLYYLLEEAAQASQSNAPGGISKGTYSWWRHQYKAITDTATGIISAFRELHMNCSNGADKPDLALCDEYTYINLEDKLQTAVRFVNPDAVDFGFENVSYKGVTIMFDKTIPDDDHDGNGDGTLFMVNSKYLKLYVGAGANFKVVSPEYDKWQDAYVGVILVDLQLTCSQMARQGVLNGGAYASAC